MATPTNGRKLARMLAASPALSPSASNSGSATTLGVYVHFPYCLAKCPYCDFLSVPVTREAIPHRAYADAVIAELERRAKGLEGMPLHSVFFGGGTPSLWDPAELGRVVSAIAERFAPGDEPIEVTAECNPSSFDDRVAEGLARAGVNRVSLGVQSLDASRLEFLGRLHGPERALEAVGLALDTGFAHVSADLIFGVAGQTSDQAAGEAHTLASLGVDHLSAYGLVIEPGTRFGELHRKGRLPLLPDDDVADCFLAIEQALEPLGFAHYEVSNYARPGGEARHNLGYWRGEPYLGLGAGATSTLPDPGGALRTRNTPSIERYLERAWGDGVGNLSGLFSTTETLDPETLLKERLMLGLRLDRGIDLVEAERATGAVVFSEARKPALSRWIEHGSLLLDGRTLRLDRKRWLVSDAILRDLL